MAEYLIKKLQKQELGYEGNVPGEARGQYFFIPKSSKHLFPNLLNTVTNDTEVLNIVTHDSRIRLMKHIHGKIAISDENGKIILLEEEIVFRRLGEIKETSQNQEKRDLLKKRLRELRK